MLITEIISELRRKSCWVKNLNVSYTDMEVNKWVTEERALLQTRFDYNIFTYYYAWLVSFFSMSEELCYNLFSETI